MEVLQQQTFVHSKIAIYHSFHRGGWGGGGVEQGRRVAVFESNKKVKLQKITKTKDCKSTKSQLCCRITATIPSLDKLPLSLWIALYFTVFTTYPSFNQLFLQHVKKPNWFFLQILTSDTIFQYKLANSNFTWPKIQKEKEKRKKKNKILSHLCSLVS